MGLLNIIHYFVSIGKGAWYENLIIIVFVIVIIWINLIVIIIIVFILIDRDLNETYFLSLYG